MDNPTPPDKAPLFDQRGRVSPPWQAFFTKLCLVPINLAASPTYANDAAAKAAGVLVGQYYRNGSVIQVRVT